MQLWLDTNFLLELVKEQEQVAACEQLLAAAATGGIQLYLPAYSLTEALHKVEGEASKRAQLQQLIQQETREARREREYGLTAQVVERETITLLSERTTTQRRRLREISRQLLGLA